MAFSYTGGATNGGTGTSATVTHGQTINSGDLVVIYLNYNDNAGSLTPTQTWDGSNSEVPSSETAQQAMYHKIEDGSAPSTYTITLGTSAQWRLTVGVWTSATDAVVDSAFATARTGTTSTDLECGAINGATLGDNCLSVICGGKDNRSAQGDYITANQSYVSSVGNTNDQASAMAHRIYGVSPSAPAAVNIDVSGGNDSVTDNTYSTHISFVESAAGGGRIMGSLAGHGGLAGRGGIAGQGGGLAN